MIKIAQILTKYRSLALVLLFLPAIGIFGGNVTHVHLVPDNPHLKFNVHFDVPARTTDEILQKVTQPVEKIFNGLPGILSISSDTQPEFLEMVLIFNETINEKSAYLNIQEKMDRIRLILPRDVKNYAVTRVKQISPPDLLVKFPESKTKREMKEALSSVLAKIERVEPDLDSQTYIEVELDVIRMAQFQISVSQVVQSLESIGLSTSMGRNNGILFETGNAFTQIDDLKSTLVGAKGGTPIRLSQVAQLNIIPSIPREEYKIWLDPQRIHIQQIENLLVQQFGTVRFKHPNWNTFLSQSVQPLSLILICFLIQILVIWVLKLPWRSLSYFFLTGLAVAVHFLFWKTLLQPPISILDLHALAMTLFMGSIFLAIIYTRIRSYFIEETLIIRPQKSLEQAKLFSLVELFPTILTLSIGFWVICIPLLSSSINLPSRLICESLFYFGIPIMLTFIVVIPLMTEGRYLTQNIHSPKLRLNWNISPRFAKLSMWSLTLLTVSSLLIFNQTHLGVSYEIRKDYPKSLMTNLRGYENELTYKFTGSAQEMNEAGWLAEKEQKLQSFKTYKFSLSGKRFVGDLDLTGFISSLQDMQQRKIFGVLLHEEAKIPLQFSPPNFLMSDIPELLVAHTKKESPLKLGLLMDSSLEVMPLRTVRDNMVTGHNVKRTKNSMSHTFKDESQSKIFPTPWSSHILDQYKVFRNDHAISLIFLFFIFAIYLNSFVRSALVVLFAIATSGFVFLVRQVLPTGFHVDSLWIIYIGTFMALFQILISARIIDIERSRGVERDLCLQEIKQNIAPTIYLCSWTFVLTLLFAGLTEYVGFSTLGFWKEAIFLALISAVILFYSNRVLFPLFYLTSEELVDRFLFRAFRIIKRKKL